MHDSRNASQDNSHFETGLQHSCVLIHGRGSGEKSASSPLDHGRVGVLELRHRVVPCVEQLLGSGAEGPRTHDVSVDQWHRERSESADQV
jgi:hypothetical protein